MTRARQRRPAGKPPRTSRTRKGQSPVEPEPAPWAIVDERQAIEDEGCGRLLLPQGELDTADEREPEPDDAVPFGPAMEPEAEEPDELHVDHVEPPEPPRAAPQVRRAADIPDVLVLTAADMAAPMPPTAWLVRELQLAPGRPTLLYGCAGAGKTVIAQSLALHVVMGIPAWGRFPTRPGRVLHVDYDQGRVGTQTRYQRLAAGHGIDLAALGDRLRCMPFPGVYLHSRDAAAFLAAHCKDTALCVIDSLRGALPGMDENDSRIGAHLQVCARVAEMTETVFLVLHHLGKRGEGATEEPRGSSAIKAAAGAAILVTGEDDTPRRLRIKRDSEFFEGDRSEDFTLRFEDLAASGELKPLRVVYDGAAPAPAADDRRNELETAILAHVRAHPGCGVTAVRTATGRNAEHVSQAIAALVTRGALRREDGPRTAVRLFVDEREPGAEDEPGR